VKHFWFRTRYISALATEVSNLHPHVLGLQIRPSTVASLIASVTRLLLPAFAQSWVHAAFREWFLPDQVVLKMQKSGEEEIVEELFDIEMKAYGRLQPLQGVIIPRFYGTLRYNGTRAMLLERLGGISMSSPEGATMRLEELSALLQPCYRAIHAFDVAVDDTNLSNFQLVDGRMMMMDLESAVFRYSADQRERFLASNIEHLAGMYRGMQAYYRFDGFLEAA
jgi:hypothetical protein